MPVFAETVVMTTSSGALSAGIISPDEALAALGGKRLEDLARAVFDAWERYRRDVAPAMGKPPGRLRATAMQALMVEEVERRFGGEVIHRHGRSLLCAVPGVVIQCKKLDDRGMPRNYPTPMALRFARQLRIPGMPAGTRLTLGYILNDLGSEVAEVRLLAQRGNGVAWSRELRVNQTVIPFVIPTTTTLPQRAAEPTQRRLKAKGSAAKKSEKKSGA